MTDDKRRKPRQEPGSDKTLGGVIKDAVEKLVEEVIDTLGSLVMPEPQPIPVPIRPGPRRR